MSNSFNTADTTKTSPSKTFNADLPSGLVKTHYFGLLLLNRFSHHLGFSPVTSSSETSLQIT